MTLQKQLLADQIIKDNKKMNMLKIISIIALISFIALQVSGEKVDAWVPACWCIIYLIKSK